jgi:hypothetical protein
MTSPMAVKSMPYWSRRSRNEFWSKMSFVFSASVSKRVSEFWKKIETISKWLFLTKSYSSFETWKFVWRFGIDFPQNLSRHNCK